MRVGFGNNLFLSLGTAADRNQNQLLTQEKSQKALGFQPFNFSNLLKTDVFEPNQNAIQSNAAWMDSNRGFLFHSQNTVFQVNDSKRDSINSLQDMLL